MALGMTMAEISALDRDWWVHRAVQAQRKAHYRILGDAEPLPELIKLRARIDWLLEMGERTYAGRAA